MVLLTGCSSSGPLGNGGSPLRRLSAARRRRRHRDVGRSRRFRRGGEAVTSLVDAVQTAFQQAKDPELKAIGSTPANMPQLARIFDLEPFLKTPSKERVAQTLDFTRGYATVVNPRPDDFPFATRLGEAISASDNPSTMSCICDVGLPYIQALLRRTGFASLDGRRNPGLWLTVGIDARYYSEITTGASAGNWLPTQPPAGDKTVPKQPSQKSGHVATALELATFLTLLYRRELVGELDSDQMKSCLSRGKWLAVGFQALGNDGGVYSKVGIILPIYSDCELVTSTSLHKQVTKDPSGADAGSSQAQPLPKTDWIAVGLNAQGTNDFTDNGLLEDLGRDLQAAVASVVQPS